MKDFLLRLTSRKFIITVAGITIVVTVSLSADVQTTLVALIGAYLASEGAGDVVDRFQSQKTEQSKLDFKKEQIVSGVLDPVSVDKSTIVAGEDVPMPPTDNYSSQP